MEMVELVQLVYGDDSAELSRSNQDKPVFFFLGERLTLFTTFTTLLTDGAESSIETLIGI